MRKAIIAVLVVVTLAVAADFGAAAVAEHAVAQQLRQRLGLPSDPFVRINGFPFLTQVLAGHYAAIDVRAEEVPVGPLHDLGVEATLHDVDAPLSQLSSGNLHSVRVERVDGRVRIQDSDLGRAIGIDDLRIEQPSAQEIQELQVLGGRSRGVVAAAGFSRADRAPVRMVASTDLAGQRIEVIGLGVIELTGGLVRITMRDVRLSQDGPLNGTGARELPSGIRQALLKTLSAEVKPGGLPFAVTPTSVWVQTGSVVVEGTAQRVTIGGFTP